MSDVDTLTLAEFLLARIAEDEARAQELAETLPWRQGTHDAPGWDQDIVYYWPDGSGALQWPSPSDGAAFIARFNPARVLAECEAKRKIVELHKTTAAALGFTIETADPADPSCVVCSAWGEYPDVFPCETIRLLAAAYADHPDYRDEWKPDA